MIGESHTLCVAWTNNILLVHAVQSLTLNPECDREQK